MHVLIVDDNATHAKLLRAVLQENGHQVREAVDGAEALAILKLESIEAVISDILMPNMDGYRLCFEIRQNENFRDLPFIFYTATYISPSDEKLCFDFGADKYLRKPASAEALLAALEEAKSASHRQPTIVPDEGDVLKDYNGRLVRKLAEQSRDLQQTTEALHTAQAQVQRHLANSPAVLYTLKIEGETLIPTVVSNNIYRLLGVDAAEATYDWWFESLHPDDRDRVVTTLGNAQEQEGYSIEYRIRHRDGSYRWVEDNNRVVRDASGRPLEMVGVWTDITKRKRTEAALKESERRFQEMLENVGLIAMTLDEHGVVTFCNEYLLELTGRERAEVIGADWFETFIPETDIAVRKLFFETIADGTVPSHNENPIKTKEGKLRQIVWNNTMLRDTLGNIIGTASIGEDVTARRQTERALQDTLDELELRVEDRTKALASANTELIVAKEFAENANLAKSGFLSRMSHELRTPMNAILGFSQLMELSTLDENQKESLNFIIKAGRHLLDLINEVLEISRIELGSLGMSLEPVDVTEALLDSISMMRTIADERSVVLNFSSVTPVYVMADRQRLRQVILNLLSNAVKYNVIGGSVNIVLRNQPERRVSIHIADTGFGMSEKMLSKLFTPFERLGADGKGIEGTGLGLVHSKTLSEAMGGKLSVRSEEGNGSCFTVELSAAEPADVEDLAAERTNPNSEIALVDKRKLLLIEDNLANAELLTRVFARRSNIELIIAMEGAPGLIQANEHVPDAILLDLHLPDMRGQDVLAQIRANPKLREIPVIIITADAFHAQSERLLDAGAFAYITKPFVLSELQSTVDAALSRNVNAA